MNIEDLRAHCISLDGVEEKMPFGKFAKRYDSILVFYVEGHMFCLVDIDDFTHVEVKSTPEEIAEISEQHISIGKPANPTMKDWICMLLDGDFSDAEIYRLVDRAYEIIKTKYTRKKRTGRNKQK